MDVPGKIRIISGKWRQRKLDVADIEGLRPTPDRVRETLFNWLQPNIAGARCLDLFAGTGSLGFEALSRGACNVVMVEQNQSLVTRLEGHANVLEATGAEIICMDVSTWLSNDQDPFDIIFLDPPYSSKQTGNIINQLLHCGCLKQGSLIYAESDHEIENYEPGLKILKSGKAGNVRFQLINYNKEE